MTEDYSMEIGEVLISKKELATLRKFDARKLPVIAEVLTERERQDAKWGEQNHEPVVWSAILSEECGEFAQAALHVNFGGKVVWNIFGFVWIVLAVILDREDCAVRLATATVCFGVACILGQLK